MTSEELKTRWEARADAGVEGPPAGYRFCHPGGHFAKINDSCSCKINTDGPRQSNQERA